MTGLDKESAITEEHDRIASVLRLLETEEGRDRTETIRRKLALLRDIRSTIERTGGNCVFDDIELFELKFFALLAEELRPLASQGHLAELPELNGVVDLLDHLASPGEVATFPPFTITVLEVEKRHIEKVRVVVAEETASEEE